MILTCGICAGLDGLIANIVLPHVVNSTVIHGILAGLSAGGAVLIGGAVLTLIG